VHIVADVVDPPEQRYPVASAEQSALHPIVSIRLPSSQFSPKTLSPSPHMGLQTEGEPVQVHPLSMTQFELQPSKFAVSASSQASTDSLIPSPQIGVQVLEAKADPPVQVQPETAKVHRSLHLEVGSTLPSSQNSVPTFHPSPQIGLHTEFEAPTQAYPSSIEQVLEHPSPLF